MKQSKIDALTGIDKSDIKLEIHHETSSTFPKEGGGLFQSPEKGSSKQDENNHVPPSSNLDGQVENGEYNINTDSNGKTEFSNTKTGNISQEDTKKDQFSKDNNSEKPTVIPEINAQELKNLKKFLTHRERPGRHFLSIGSESKDSPAKKHNRDLLEHSEKVLTSISLLMFPRQKSRSTPLPCNSFTTLCQA
jgi:hypothetical protein